MIGAETNLQAPSPERWVAARVECDGAEFAAGSFACPPGVDWGDMKTEQGRQIAEWLASRPDPVFAGIDRNDPKYERFDGSVELWPRDAPELLGPDPAHRLQDALTTVLERDPQRRTQAAAERPDGPLAVSFVRGHPGQRQAECRYDVIYASEDFTVVDVRYLYDDAVAAGSDHAAVVATFDLG